ncbi:lycopene cyclase domain-containing protein [Tersicoccus sp. MR15.9]|uniref:lycopene cyclase domain-containing protein n=1 Tax=Tersicoccus mangrovi TaxID=3121635 RepID=UPI002FE6032F
MTYTALNVVVLLVAGVFAVLAHRVANRRRHDGGGAVTDHAEDAGRPDRPWYRRHPRRTAALATLVILLVLATVFDSVIVGVGLVAYDRSRISGFYAGLAPVEDLAYVVGAVLVLPAVWRLLGTGRSRPEPGRRRSAGRGIDNRDGSGR